MRLKLFLDAKAANTPPRGISKASRVIFSVLTLLFLSIGQVGGTATTVKWTRVTSVSTLTSGGTFIMGYEATAKSGTIIPLRSKDCNATTSANGYFYTGTTSGSSTNGTIDMSTVTSTSDYEVYISSPATGKINIQRATSSGNYYGATSGGTTSNKARLYTSGNSNETNLTPEWASETNNQFKLTAGVSGSYKYLKYNTGSPRFAYYNSAGEKIVFYKKVTLSSISVRTAPTKTSYAEGESFAPAGLVIRKTWSDNSTEDITYNNTTASDFTFSPSTSTTLTTSNTSVTITYGGKSTSQSITVAASGCDNKVTLATGNPSNGTISFSPTGPVETCDGNVNVTMTITPNAGYYLSTYSKTGVNTSNTPSITTGTSATAAQTPTLTFAQNATGTYTAGATFTAFVDHFIDEVQSSTGYTGEGMAKSGDYSGSLPTIADKTVATTGNCQALHYHFCGWVTEANRANPHGHLATINGTATGTTYYAVWAKQGAGEGGDFDGEHEGSFYIYADISGTKYYATGFAGKMEKSTNISNAALFTFEKIVENNKTYFAIKSGSNYLSYGTSGTDFTYNGTDPYKWEPTQGQHGSWRMKVTTGSTSRSIVYRAGSTNKFAPYGTSNINGTEYYDVEIGGSVSYTDSITVCCTELGSINGSVELSQTTAALEWADLDNVSSWAVQYKEHSAENWNTWNGAQSTANSKRSVTITSLSCGTAYDFKIAATGESGYCDAEEVKENQSTTKWNISYSLSGTVSLNEGPAQGANACGEIEATFTKNSSYTFPDAITVTVGDAALATNQYTWNSSTGALSIAEDKVTGDVAITIAGVAPANPIVTPNPTALSFTQVKKGADVPAAQDIALEGHNLTAALTVESSNTSLYVVSVKSGSLTPDVNKDASLVITVTPQAGITSTAGDKDATITISGGGLAADVVVNVTFNVQETYTVNWYVNGTKIDDNSVTDIEGTEVTAPSDFSAFVDCVPDFHFIGWKEGSAIDEGSSTSKPTLVTPITAIGTTATTNYYAVFAEGTPASVDTLLYEEFDNTTTSDASSEFATSKFPNFNGSLSKAYTSQYGGVKFGTGSVAGYITSKSLDLSEAFTVSLKARYYNTGGDNASIQVTVGSQTKTISYEDLTNDFKSFSLDFDAATSTSTVKIGTDVKRAYIDNVLVSQTIAEDFSMYYTTCPHVSRVTLSAAEVSNGSISFAVNSEAVTNVRTDGDDAIVDVVASPATGYELTDLTLTSDDVTGASKNVALTQITIPEDEEGTLTVTAAFGLKNYSIAVETYPSGIGATLTGATSTAKYNVEQTISTDEPVGYIFGGWYMYNAEDTGKETDLSPELFTGPYAGGDLEFTASFLMPDKNLVAEAYFDKIYTPAEALALSDLTDSVYVEGVISQVDEVSTQYKNATYWISADGTTTNQIKIYRGKHLNNGDVTVANAGQIAVGNKVIVRGKLSKSSNINQFGQGASYIYELTEKALSALAIVGDASITTYDVGDSFDKTGLSLTATYNTGYVQANYTGATMTSDYDAPATFTADVTKVTVSASEGLINTSRDIAVTVSNAVLDHVEIASGAQTEFWANETYKEPKLNAYLNDEPATVLANVTGVTDQTGLDMSVAGNKSVVITYTRKAGQSTTVDYDFTVKAVAVDEANAHSVATAREIIDVDLAEKAASATGLDLAEEDTKTHVIGVVKSVSGSSPYTIVIKDQTDESLEMTLYQVTLKSGIESVEAGDLIKAYGNLYYYTSTSKYEINTGGQVVWKQPKVGITIADKTLEVGDVWTIDATIAPVAAPVTYSIKAGSDACITLAGGVITATAEGEATIIAHADA